MEINELKIINSKHDMDLIKLELISNPNDWKVEIYEGTVSIGAWKYNGGIYYKTWINEK
jgi:hypothetical protein